MSIDQLTSLFSRYMDAGHTSLAIIVVGLLCRAWHAAGGWRGWTNLGGLVGIVKALLFGTNTPAAPKAAGGAVRTYADPPNPPVGDPPPDPPDPGTTTQN